MKKDVTILIAHPDDEFLFGFPVIQRAKKIIACVDDMTHPTRQWCRQRKDAFAEVCKLVGADCVCLRYDSGFAKLDAGRNAPIGRFVAEVRDTIKDAECVYTHNDWGEYGHLDHQFLNTIVKMNCSQSMAKMWTSDIVLEADWYSPRGYSQGGHSLGCVQNDLDFHNKCAGIYRKYGAFGWACPPVEAANIIEVHL